MRDFRLTINESSSGYSILVDVHPRQFTVSRAKVTSEIRKWRQALLREAHTQATVIQAPLEVAPGENDGEQICSAFPLPLRDAVREMFLPPKGPQTLLGAQLLADKLFEAALETADEAQTVPTGLAGFALSTFGELLVNLFFRAARGNDESWTLRSLVRDAFQAARTEGQSLRLLLQFGCDGLRALHWEIIRDHLTISLGLTQGPEEDELIIERAVAEVRDGPPPADEVLRVLAVMMAPRGDPLAGKYGDINAAANDLRKRLCSEREGQSGLDIRVIPPTANEWPGENKTALKLILDHVEDFNPHVLLYFGHGDVIGGRGLLIAEDAKGQPVTITLATFADGIKRSFRTHPATAESLRLFVFLACRAARPSPGAAHDRAQQNGDDMSTLLRGRGTAAIGMRLSVMSDMAIAMCEALLSGLSSEARKRHGGVFAYWLLAELRAAAQTRNSINWANPVLFNSSRDGKLFDAPRGEPEKPSNETPRSAEITNSDVLKPSTAVERTPSAPAGAGSKPKRHTATLWIRRRRSWTTLAAVPMLVVGLLPPGSGVRDPRTRTTPEAPSFAASQAAVAAIASPSSAGPTEVPTSEPTVEPTATPTIAPTETLPPSPTVVPTKQPTQPAANAGAASVQTSQPPAAAPRTSTPVPQPTLAFPSSTSTATAVPTASTLEPAWTATRQAERPTATPTHAAQPTLTPPPRPTTTPS